MKRSITIISSAAIALAIFASCANQGANMLSGGPKDETPPEVVKSVPENYTTNFVATEVEITFDEYLKQTSGLNKKVVISPVMEELPDIQIRGKKLLIKFNGALLPDRTYALNFGESVADLNENNHPHFTNLNNDKSITGPKNRAP